MNRDRAGGGYWSARFQDAALAPSQWLAVLGELADATGSSRAELIGIAGKSRLFDWISAMDPSMPADFAMAGAYSPAVNYRIAADMGSQPLTIVHEADYDRVRPSLISDDYVDVCERYHMPFGCQTSLIRDNGILVGLSVHRSRRDGRTSEAQRETFRRAATGALLAVRMQQAIEQQGFHLLQGTFEAMSVACLLLDGGGTVRAASPEAERMLAEQPLLGLRDGRIRCVDGGQQRKVDLALREILGPAEKGLVRVLLNGETLLPELTLDIFGLPPREWSMVFAPRAVVVVRAARPNLRGQADLLARHFALTPAEAGVAVALCEGESRESIAAGRGVSPETVRAQLKSLYQKTGCHRETELVLLFRAVLG